MTTINMTAIGNRPTTVISHLENIDTNNLYVQCRLPSGEDGYVSFKEILNLIEREHVKSAEHMVRQEV